MNNNGTNLLPGLAKALYLLELKKENKNELKNINMNERNDKKYIKIENKVEEIDNSFYIRKFNELNGFIGELGYSYVYNEFVVDNYTKENLIIYFDNIKKLINMLHQTVNSQNEILMKQENQIKEYENYINDYQKNINKYKYNSNYDTGLISRKEKDESIGNININNFNENSNKLNATNHIIINENNENISYNNIENNNTNNNIYNNDTNNNINNIYDDINSQDFDKIKECKNIFTDNLINNKIDTPKNTPYYNSYISQLNNTQNNENNYKENYNINNNTNKIIENSINNFSDNNFYTNYNDIKDINKENLPPEKSNKYLNYSNEQNIFSSMINSSSFFESYKRNKELKHNLNFNYNERCIKNE